jgi:hypothetical protein
MSSARPDMNLDLHPDLRVCQLEIGAERAPLLVIDNFVANAQALVADACARPFTVRSPYFPASGPRHRPHTNDSFSHD